MVIGTDDEFLSIPKSKELFRMIPSKLKKIRFATGSHTEIRLESLIEQIVDFANAMGKKFKYVQGMDIAVPTNVKELGQSTKSGNAPRDLPRSWGDFRVLRHNVGTTPAWR